MELPARPSPGRWSPRRSQIATTADFIDTRRGGIGPERGRGWRTRAVCSRWPKPEADPVTALDTARSSATYSRDADALARYDVMGRDPPGLSYAQRVQSVSSRPERNASTSSVPS